jgi:NAD(P)-dependent dehydrogenase (short-subunit alcohol dehydrogenase family)
MATSLHIGMKLREGLPVALVARSKETLDAVDVTGVPVVHLAADSTDEVALRTALDGAAAKLGPPDVLVYNAARIRPDAPGELTTAELLATWAVNVAGALTAAAHVAPGMAERGRGTIIVTGGMPEPKPQYTSLSLGKAGVRTLVELLDAQYGASGVHVASVTVHGEVAPGTAFDPDDIAEHYWRLHTQPKGEWQLEAHHR